MLATLCAAQTTTLTGKFSSAAGQPVAGGTLTLALSQAGTVPGTHALAASPVSCYTSTDGSVIGTPNPSAAPTLSWASEGGFLPGGLYYVKVAYVTGSLSAPTAFSLPSPEGVVDVASPTGHIVVSSPPTGPVSASGYAVYIGSTTGGETLQGTDTLGTSFYQEQPLASGSVPATENTTACALQSNDAIIPPYTYYTVTLADSEGNTVAGFPQSWYLSGASVDVSQLIPLATNPAARFPLPVLQNPTNNYAQSVASDLNLNGNSLVDAANVGPGVYSFWAAGLPAVGNTLYEFTPSHSIDLVRLNARANFDGAGGTSGITITASQPGSANCAFAQVLYGAEPLTVSDPAAGPCPFAANQPITLTVSADDHQTEPAQINFSLEVSAGD